MLRRVFLGWDEPFLHPLVAWLLERKAELPGMLVVVPTTQSGRHLREALAEAGEAILAPKVATPGSLLRTADDPAVAPDWMETVAWTEALEEISDWSPYEALFPEVVPDDSSGWLAGIAVEMVSLRRSLQEGGLTLARAARKLANTVEAERWEAMARLETLAEQRLKLWQMKSRSRTLAEHFSLPQVQHIVLAGITEMPPLLERALENRQGPVSILIGAPETEAAHFTPTGQPWHEPEMPEGTPAAEKIRREYWRNLPLPWPEEPHGSIILAADSRQQATEALRAVRRHGQPSSAVALGSADADVSGDLEREFTRAGWTAFDPAAETVAAGLVRWFGSWRQWLADPKLSILSDLLTMPETSPLVDGDRAGKAKLLSELRDRWMVIRPEDLRRRLQTAEFREEWKKDAATTLSNAITKLESWAAAMRRGDVPGVLGRLLDQLSRTGEATAEAAGIMKEWLEEAAPLISDLRRPTDYWIELMVSSVTAPSAAPPVGRVIDIQGWLELFYEPGRHLVICGMNEGKVPARSTVDPWLSENIRSRLELTTDAHRAARDAFLYTAMIRARSAGGRCDLICGKGGGDGSALLPSRLLLAAPADDLPGRVKTLFREIEPPEAGMRWEADWLWLAREKEPPERLSVTSLSDYLSCPFRYYLKHVIAMSSPEPDRPEWNPRDFGTVTHEVLERWGNDTEAREFDKPEALEKWLLAELDRVVREWFGKSAPLAVRIQREAMTRRFQWLARVQAAERAAGWRVIDVERKILIPAGGASIVAKMDRVDLNEHDGRRRVIDYKTGKVDSVDRAHRKKITNPERLPSHTPWESPVIHDGEEKGKPVHYQWTNLQLPLYAAAVVARGEGFPIPCYFTFGLTEAEVKIHEWSGFSGDDLASATACADWIAAKIAAKEFWPPAPSPTYDDYHLLGYGRHLEDAFQPLSGGKEPA